MARIRTIKPEFWQDEDIASCSHMARLLAIGLLNHADDEGYFKAHKQLVKAAVFPFDDNSTNVQRGLDELSRVGFVCLCIGSDGKEYGLIKNFCAHQRIDRPSHSKIKDLFNFDESSKNPLRVLDAGKDQGKERKGKESIGEVGKPTITDNVIEVIAFLNEKSGKAYEALNPSGGLTSNGKLVANLLKRGYTVQKIKTVTMKKCRQWVSTDMADYLRPKTLYNATNFDNYLGECVVKEVA